MIELEIIPFGKPRLTHGMRHTEKAKTWYRYGNMLYTLAKAQKYHITLPLSLTFVMPMPNYWSGKRKERTNNTWHTQTPDTDNMVKGFMDALLEQDSAVCAFGGIKKIWGYEGKIIIHDKYDFMKPDFWEGHGEWPEFEKL